MNLETPRPPPFIPYSPALTEYSEKDNDESTAFLPSSSSTLTSPTHSRSTSTSISTSPQSPTAWAHSISRRFAQRNFTRRALLATMLSAVAVVTLLSSIKSSNSDESLEDGWYGKAKGSLFDWTGQWSHGATDRDAEELLPPLNLSKVLNFDTPQATLKSQLKEGVRYATAMSYGGHANQMISIQKLLYFAKITNRVPIIPSLIPVHIDGGGPQNISTFYDLPRLYRDSGIPALEMSQLKALQPDQPHNEELASWSVQEATAGFPNFEAVAFDLHGIFVHHWPLPPLARGAGGFDLAFDALKIFDFDVGYKFSWIERVKREFLPQKPLGEGKEEIQIDDQVAREKNMKDGFDPRNSPAPDDQIVAFDNSLFLGPVMFKPIDLAREPTEPTIAGEGTSWMEVGQHLHFTRLVEQRADEYLSEIFNVRSIDQVPPFITVHLRRGDFAQFTGYTDLDKYVKALERLLVRLQERIDDPEGFSGPGKNHFRPWNNRLPANKYEIVATTDEKSDSSFVEKVKALGWKVLDHEKFETKEKYGGWWPVLLDMAILARGKSFVGTDRSTYTHLAGLRVKYWNGGIVEIA